MKTKTAVIAIYERDQQPFLSKSMREGNTMIIEVIKGGSPLTEQERQQIKDIFIESQCPNESLKNSLKGFKSFDSRTLHIDDGTGDQCGYPEEIEV